MKRFGFNKLVRDKIVPNMIAQGRSPDYKILSDEEYVQELKKKIVEEASEVVVSDREHLPREVADIQEIIDILLGVLKINKRQLKNIGSKRVKEAGSFKKRYFVKTVGAQEGSEWLEYFLSHPDRYPEVK